MSEDIDNKEAYMRAMVEARRERDEYYNQLMDMSIDAYEWLDTLARALGIQTGRESWWDNSEAKQREMVLGKIRKLKKSVDKKAQVT